MQTALADLTRRWERYWPGADSAAIARDVDERLAGACAQWALAEPIPLNGGGVALTCAAGDRVVKVLPRLHPEAAAMRGEGEALVHWRDSRAAAELVDTRDDGMTLLMRRIRPALTLDEAVGDYHEQLAITGTLVRRLHEAGRPPAALPGIDAYVDPYRRVLGRELDELLESSPPAVAAHADLHGGNVLLDRDRWVAIDPKGVRGDPHLDVWLLLCPQAPALPDERHAAREEMWRRIRVYSDAAGLDPGRAADWARAIARAEAVLSPDSAYPGWPTRLERVADAL